MEEGSRVPHVGQLRAERRWALEGEMRVRSQVQEGAELRTKRDCSEHQLLGICRYCGRVIGLTIEFGMGGSRRLRKHAQGQGCCRCHLIVIVLCDSERLTVTPPTSLQGPSYGGLFVGCSRSYPDIPLSAQWKQLSIQTPKGKRNFPTQGLSFPSFPIIYADPEDWAAPSPATPALGRTCHLGMKRSTKNLTQRLRTWILFWTST